MKRRSTETGSMQHFARSACVMLLIMALLGPSNFLLTAQTTPTAQPTPPAQSPPAQTTPSGPSAENATISPDQLDSLVAPIALYPDNLLAQMLAASTYPLELVQLHQWLQKNPDLAKDQKKLTEKVEKQPWDPSIQAMYDVATKKQIWRGEATKTLGNPKSPEKIQKNLDKATKKLLKNYPPPVK